jgi:hypothetical protein
VPRFWVCSAIGLATAFAAAAGCTALFPFELNSWSCLSAFGGNNPKPGADTAPPPAPPPPPAAETNYTVGQTVFVLWGTEWWPGKIIETGPSNRDKVTYEGYDSSWDDIVPTTRLRSR